MSEEESSSSSSQWTRSENENIYIVNWIRCIVVVVCWKETFKLRSFSSFFSSIGLNYVVIRLISLNHRVAINRENFYYYILKWRKLGLMYHGERELCLFFSAWLTAKLKFLYFSSQIKSQQNYTLELKHIRNMHIYMCGKAKSRSGQAGR